MHRRQFWPDISLLLRHGGRTIPGVCEGGGRERVQVGERIDMLSWKSGGLEGALLLEGEYQLCWKNDGVRELEL